MADLKFVQALEARCFGTSDGGFTPMQLKRLVANPRALWHIIGDGLAAACWLRASNGRARWARLYSLAVDPTARRRGFAQSLLNHGLDVLRSEGFASVRLEVRADNTPAIELYRAFAFETCARLPDYYGRGLDGVRLVRAL